MTKIGVLGAGGRMGRMIIEEIAVAGKQGKARLGAAVEQKESAHVGAVAADGVKITADVDAAFETCDVLIDFTAPDACAAHAGLAARHGKPLVVGTTGLSKTEEETLIAASKKTAIFYTANMSIGVNLLLALVEQAAAKLDETFDIEIFEAHHRHKVDAPSGTALAVARAAAKGRDVRLEEALVCHVPSVGPRRTGAIGMTVSRGGDIVGEHKVTFAGLGERLELTHRATDRAIFAKGAVRAALWLKDRPAGVYSMNNLLGK
ncbi:MAG: 4-hydroxy-tetrahydrodipicolinate reductase [Alphaproteobacteria bacterium]|nr:4-hydroxy-tetrahydrodipicolinate reductase [Alphaproteobacteria bacterium]